MRQELKSRNDRILRMKTLQEKKKSHCCGHGKKPPLVPRLPLKELSPKQTETNKLPFTAKADRRKSFTSIKKQILNEIEISQGIRP